MLCGPNKAHCYNPEHSLQHLQSLETCTVIVKIMFCLHLQALEDGNLSLLQDIRSKLDQVIIGVTLGGPEGPQAPSLFIILLLCKSIYFSFTNLRPS